MSTWVMRLTRLLAGTGALLLILCALTVLALRWHAPPTSAFMLQAKWGGGSVEQRWVPLDEISPHAVRAVLAAEDQRFFEHWGFDLPSVQAAWAHHRAGGRLRGASTLSQQVAKNLFLWPARDPLRKGIEAALTTLIETLWPKTRILEVYLNIAQFGEGVYGIGMASERYFGKSPHELSVEEAATLAAVLPNPVAHRAHAPTPRLEQRRQRIQARMDERGKP
jgi:monofunctional glycosyltransferase